MLIASACGPTQDGAETPELLTPAQRTDRLTTTVALEPEADTFVVYGGATSNFGDWDHFSVHPAWRSAYQNQFAFLRFNLSSLPAHAEVTSVKLQATAYTGHAYGGDGNTYTHLMATDTWNEMTLSWVNMPGVTGSSLGHWWIHYSDYTADRVVTNEAPELAAAVSSEFSGDKKISLRLHSTGYSTYYYSRESPNADRRPKLLITYTEPACLTEPPTLTLNGNAEMAFECGPGTYSDPGAQAFDGCGQPLEVQAYNTGNDSSGPGPLVDHEGVYYVSYTTWNNQGAASASRIVTVTDETPPTLTLNGPAFMTHTCNTPWEDPGAEATDACYASVSDAVVRTGEVNAWAEGTYTVTYSVTDAAGNSAPSVTRTVEVVDCPW